MPPLVYLESPFAGDVALNVAYARLCVADSLRRGEAPFASHLFYTQPCVLDDRIPEERALGMASGFAWGKRADLTAVYQDLGISSGMREGIDRACREGRRVEYRTLGRGWATAAAQESFPPGDLEGPETEDPDPDPPTLRSAPIPYRPVSVFTAGEDIEPGQWVEIGPDGLARPARTATAEVRITDPTTGGQKGQKPERYDLVPPDAWSELARVFGFGAIKYDDRNWERGYAWSLTLRSISSHLAAIMSGEDRDKESGCLHFAHIAWHGLVGATFTLRGVGRDDRPKGVQHPEHRTSFFDKAVAAARAAKALIAKAAA